RLGNQYKLYLAKESDVVKSMLAKSGVKLAIPSHAICFCDKSDRALNNEDRNDRTLSPSDKSTPSPESGYLSNGSNNGSDSNGNGKRTPKPVFDHVSSSTSDINSKVCI